MIRKQNIVENKHSIYGIAAVILMFIFSFADKSYASANTSDPFYSSPCVIDCCRYDETKTINIKYDSLEKYLSKSVRTIPLFGINFMPKGLSLISILSPLLFEKDLWEPEDNFGVSYAGSSLPLIIPGFDHPPFFQSVQLSSGVSFFEKICFTGFVKDDARLKNLKIVLSTPAGSSFELVNTPISGCSIDLSEFCIDGIDDLHKDKGNDYKIILSVKDSANHIISKTFFISPPAELDCRQDMPGGQCVNYVRNYFGGSFDLMPGLCMYADCGAYHAWEAWDLGYGKGWLPEKKSILIMDKGRLLFGHVAVVLDWKQNAGGTYTLTVCESNWDRDELIDCNVRYTYYPETLKIIREGRRKSYDVAGFIYSDTVRSQKDIPPEYENATLPNLVKYPDKVYFRGYAKDDVGLKEVKIEVSGPKGNRLPVFKGIVSGISKDLSDFWFDSSNIEYAGVEGHYIVKLIVVDTNNQEHSRIFPVLVNSVN